MGLLVAAIFSLTSQEMMGCWRQKNGEDYVGEERGKDCRTKCWDRKYVHRCHPTVLVSGKMKVTEKPNQLDSVVKKSPFCK